LDSTLTPKGDPDSIRASVENCIRMIGGVKKIDIFESARVDPNTPIEVTVGELDKLVKEGKIGGIGLSEVGPETIRKAAKVAKIAAVETEVNLYEDNVFSQGIAAACAELNIPIVAYSPLGRGFLTGAIKTPDDLTDFHKRFPRFQGENFQKNLELADKVKKHAEEEGITAAQYSIAWVASRGKLPNMPLFIPIPGATTKARVTENLTIKNISLEKFKDIDEFVKTFEPAGTRYPEHGMKLLNG
jgi:pyridoxine 4-dehydrogenase